MDKSSQKAIKDFFGKKLKELRHSKGFSQESLALACELDRTYIGSVERGERNVSLINIYKIAAALNVNPSQLLDEALND